MPAAHRSRAALPAVFVFVPVGGAGITGAPEHGGVRTGADAAACIEKVRAR